MGKKFCVFSTLLTLVLLVAIVTPSAHAEEYGSEDNERLVMTAYDGYVMHTRNSYGRDFLVPYGTVVGWGNITSGEYVYAVQAALTEANGVIELSCDPYGIDGQFGSNTYNAIYNFQYGMVNRFNISMAIDGYAGDQTWAQLQYWTQEY